MSDLANHSGQLSREDFTDWVRDALTRLYDSAHLNSHPLAAMLTEQKENAVFTRSQELRRVLLQAIRSLRPGPGCPSRSTDWRLYQILELRYIEGQTPREAMNALSVGRSQFFRDQARALATLTDTLWKPARQISSPTTTVEATARDSTREALFERETKRLYNQATWEDIDVEALLNGIRTTVAPLARTREASVDICLSGCTAVLRSDRVILRQAILNAITYALGVARGGRVEVGDYADETRSGIRIVGWLASSESTTILGSRHQHGDLNFCKELTEALKGRFKVRTDSKTYWETHLEWDIRKPPTLLVIDNNADLVTLFRRYLAGSGWQVIGAASGAETRAVVMDTHPSAITLDVMMPEEDGWELLSFLKQSPQTKDIPVIICSVLNQPQLALELGAQAYLQKPVTPRALRQAVVRWDPAVANLGPAR